MIRLLMGDAIGYFGYVDNELRNWGPTKDYFSERLAFLLGTKIETENVGDYNDEVDHFLYRIKELRDGAKWWQRGMVYMDTIGVHNQRMDLVDIRRFDDHTGKTVLAVDNYRNVSGLSVRCHNMTFHIDDINQLSLIEVPKLPVPRTVETLKTDDNAAETKSVSASACPPSALGPWHQKVGGNKFVLRRNGDGAV